MKETKPVEFHALTTLLHVAQAINSVSDDKSVENIRRKCCSGYLYTMPALTTTGAIASILVQRHDVNIVAASFQELDKVSVVVASTNPKIDNLGSSSELASDSLKPGHGIWNEVRDCRWYSAFKEPLPLLEHIATLSAYLQEYNSLQDDEIRGHNSFHFGCYLLTACWPEMLRRITSAQALGLISALDTLSLDSSNMPISLGFKAGPDDETLGEFLTWIEEDAVAKDFLSYSETELSSLKEIVSSIQSELPPLSRATSGAFAKLVSATFRGFATSLIKLSTEHKKLELKEQTFLESVDDPSLTPQQRVVLNTFRELGLRTTLLCLFIRSTSFKTYLHALFRQYQQRMLPRSDKFHEYLQYKRTKLCPTDISGPKVTENNMGGEESEKEEKDVRDEEGVQVEEDDNYHFYLGPALPYPTEKDLKERLHRYTMTFVLQFVALQMLEAFFYRAPKRDLHITLLSMERPQLSIPTSSWEIMQAFIKESCGFWGDNSAVAAKKALDILERTLAPETDQSAPKCSATLSTFRPLVEQNPERTEIRFTGGMHCETALMMIGKYFQHVLHCGSEGDLMSECKSLVQSAKISISKVCCPVCCDLLSILDDRMALRYCGSTAYPVGLPEWLPSGDIHTLTEKLRRRLRVELHAIVK